MKHLVLLGAGHAHIHVLSQLTELARKGPLPCRVTLVAPYPRQLYSGMMPGFVAGHYALEDCAIDLEPLLNNTSIEWQPCSATALTANARVLGLDDGTELEYDWLSINTGAVQNRPLIEKSLPGAREYGLFVRPMEAFGALWPRVLKAAEEHALHLSIVGGGAAGVELAMAVAHRLQTSSVTLITGGSHVAPRYPISVQQRVLKALEHTGVTVLMERAIGIESGQVVLSSGARLACDIPLIAIGAQAPTWLAKSGLALDEQGFIEVDACQRSSSHHEVFAVGDVSTRADQTLARSGVYAVRAGPALARNLAAVLADAAPSPHTPPQRTLNLLSCGDQQAIASWGNYSVQGRWVWKLKDRIDRAFIARYRPKV